MRTPVEVIRDIFGTEEPFVSIASCESGLRQFKPDGTVLHGLVHPADTGIMMVNMVYWADEAKKRKLDVDTLEGNIAMAKVIYDSQGLGAWNPSRTCWQPLAQKNGYRIM